MLDARPNVDWKISLLFGRKRIIYCSKDTKLPCFVQIAKKCTVNFLQKHSRFFIDI